MLDMTFKPSKWFYIICTIVFSYTSILGDCLYGFAETGNLLMSLGRALILFGIAGIIILAIVWLACMDWDKP